MAEGIHEPAQEIPSEEIAYHIQPKEHHDDHTDICSHALPPLGLALFAAYTAQGGVGKV